MNHYEIVVILNSSKIKNINSIIYKYKCIINLYKGKIYRIENWGYRKLAYKINNFKKAYYICLNIKINYNFLKKIKNMFKFDKNISRLLIIKLKKAEIKPSFMLKK